MTPIEKIEEYPIPSDREAIIQIQMRDLEREKYSKISSRNQIEKTVDGFHEKYINTLTRTDEWQVFEDRWNYGKWIYFWNWELGYGFKVDSDWEVMCPFVTMMEEFTEEYSSGDFEPAHYSWELP